MVIKGRYVATIAINLHYDESRYGVRPFDSMKEGIIGGELANLLSSVVRNDIFDPDMCDVSVNQQYADLYRTEESDGRT